jgi:hypothetical protein
MGVGEEGIVGLLRVQQLLREEHLGQRLRVHPHQQRVPVARVVDPDSETLWIRIRIGSGFRDFVDPDPDWIRIQRLCGSVLGIRIQGQEH